MAPKEPGIRPSGAFFDMIGSVVKDSIAKSSGQSREDAVWWDNVMTAPQGQGLSEHTQGVMQPTRLGADDQTSKIYSYFGDPNKRMQFATDLYKVGAMNDSRGFTQIGYFAGASAQALAMYKASGSNMPFTQWLATTAAKSDRKVPGLDDGSNGPGGGGPRAFTNVTTNLTNRDDARATVDAALGEWLGRSATKAETDKFWKALNKYQSRNPSVDKGVSGPGGTTATRVSGANPEVFAEDYAKSQDDYAETTFATTALDLITKSIMGDTTEGLM